MKPAYFAGGWPVKERIFDGRNADAPPAFLESHAKARKVGDRVPQLPKAFWGSEGVMECSGLAELWMGIERFEGENPKRCQATAVQKRRIRKLTRRRGGAEGWG
jgi:hypothetical protein